MLRGLDGLAADRLEAWIKNSLAKGEHTLAHGNQGQVLLYPDAERRLVIKVPTGRGLRRWLSIAMLRHEARVYERLVDFPAAPRCYGLLRGRYLVLDYVAGEPARYAEIADREAFFVEFLQRIQALHQRGIAHSDLQKKDNLWLVAGRHPLLLDFGAAVIQKAGFAPFNRLHFRFAKQLDYNQWAKLKYRGRLDLMSDTDRHYYRRSLLEKWARRLKSLWRSRR